MSAIKHSKSVTSPQARERFLYTAEQCREFDRVAIEEHDIESFTLMQRAGESAYTLLRERWPQTRSLNIICGKGNNGGDGFVVGELAHKGGFEVTVLAPQRPESGDAHKAMQRYLDAGGRIVTDSTQIKPADCCVDALLGTGLVRHVQGQTAATIAWMNRQATRILALDTPSGLNVSTGAIMGSAVRANATITFIANKRGLYTGDGPAVCGEVTLDELGLPRSVFARQPHACEIVTWRDFASDLRLQRAAGAHKGTAGHVLVVGGAPGMAGAPRMTGEAALRTGAGLVTVATHADHASALNANCPELICFGARAADWPNSLLQNIGVMAIGPGLGLGLGSGLGSGLGPGLGFGEADSKWGEHLWNLLIDVPVKKVVDADALNWLARAPRKRDDWVLTPHPGEAARLLGTTTQAVQNNRFAALDLLQKKYGGCIVLKGAGSLSISSDGQQRQLCTAGNQGMASAGMGDVLTGVIAGLIAQGLDLSTAASLGVWLHASAGDDAASDGGMIGMKATDLLPHIRQRRNNPMNSVHSSV